MASSTVATFLSTLRTNLAARPGLSGVRVDLVPPKDQSQIEAILLMSGRIAGEQTYEGAAMGRRRDTYRIPAKIDTFASGADIEAAFQTGMDRAAAILDEVILELRDNKPVVGTAMLQALVTDIGYTALAPDDGGIVARCDFTIEYGAHVA
jgi:hypothetical protein